MTTVRRAPSLPRGRKLGDGRGHIFARQKYLPGARATPAMIRLYEFVEEFSSQPKKIHLGVHPVAKDYVKHLATKEHITESEVVRRLLYFVKVHMFVWALQRGMDFDEMNEWFIGMPPLSVLDWWLHEWAAKWLKGDEAIN